MSPHLLTFPSKLPNAWLGLCYNLVTLYPVIYSFSGFLCWGLLEVRELRFHPLALFLPGPSPEKPGITRSRGGLVLETRPLVAEALTQSYSSSV